MSGNRDTYRQKLNNYLQDIGDCVNLRYEYSTVGPLHDATWTVTARIWGTVYGTGTAPTKGEAKEAAARQAYFSVISRG